MKGISIVICCYNSGSRIEETLHHIFKLKVVDQIQYEVLVVNNNSTDNTVERALRTEQVANDKGFIFRLIDEPNPGLTSARMAGVKAASFEIICFCDDDNHLSSEYFVIAANIFNSHSQVGLVGGFAKPKFSVATGEWIKDFYAAMAIGPQAQQDGFVQWIYGAGMVLRKEIFTILASKKIDLILSDRKGNVLTSGGDSEICSLAVFLGFKIYYSSEMILFHAIPSHRLKKKHYLKAPFSTIYPSVYLYILDDLIKNNRANAWSTLYIKKINSSVRGLFYSMPRVVFGKHNFYSLFMTYRTLQMLIWLLVYKKKFKQFYYLTLNNLKL